MSQAGYLQKEVEIIKVLRESDYAVYGGDKDKALEQVEANFMAIGDYFSTKVNFEVNDFLDKYRTMAEPQEEAGAGPEEVSCAMSAAAISIGELNELCGKLGIGKFADIDIRDEEAVTRICEDFVHECFLAGTRGIGVSAENSPRK